MSILVAAFSDEEPAQESTRDPLQDGFTCEGSVFDMADNGPWNDNSAGESYGRGNRYAHEETAYMTRVASKHK